MTELRVYLLVEDLRPQFAAYMGTPMRARGAESALAGRRPDAAVLTAAGAALDRDLDPPGDLHGSPALRRHLARVLLARVVRRLVEERS